MLVLIKPTCIYWKNIKILIKVNASHKAHYRLQHVRKTTVNMSMQKNFSKIHSRITNIVRKKSKYNATYKKFAFNKFEYTKISVHQKTASFPGCPGKEAVKRV